MRALALALALSFAAGAAAQLRTIPPQAQPGTLRHVMDLAVELNGQMADLAPGAQIRDADNRLILPASLTETITVRYLLDGTGKLHRAWILSAQEKAALPPAPYPK
jgi:anti-sigma factor ChrR (cupin superfamily)